jgi:hypothetical protein
LILAANADIFSERAVAAPERAARPSGERHHYTIGARVRPLVFFWIARGNVGDAIVTRHQAEDEARYSLLIGTDPARTPMHINRWGYIEEEIHGGDARLVGVMTESDEQSVEEAESSIRQRKSGTHPFKVIRGAATATEAHARVASVHASEDYTLHDIAAVLDLAGQAVGGGTLRVVRLPPGTRPGFLAALADAMHGSADRAIQYAYYGRLYELRRIRSRRLPDLQIAGRSYGPAISADFVVISRHDGEQTNFTMTYGTEGRFAEVPLKATYQPRWWMQIDLTIDDAGDADGRPS